jgi:hypothetical protein
MNRYSWRRLCSRGVLCSRSQSNFCRGTPGEGTWPTSDLVSIEIRRFSIVTVALLAALPSSRIEPGDGALGVLVKGIDGIGRGGSTLPLQWIVLVVVIFVTPPVLKTILLMSEEFGK